jgi:hypothetical protein
VPDRRDPNPQCEGECEALAGGFWDDVRWTVYVCQDGGTLLAAVEGGTHWWNDVSSEDSRKRLGVSRLDEEGAS